MANLPETSVFDANVNEIQTSDLVLGGPSGPANAGPQNLTNRTRWLFDQVNALAADVTSINSDIATINGQISTINGQIGSINANLASINGQLPLLAPIANPSFTGLPTAPTPGSFVNNGQLSTTAYVFNWFAPKASPALTGTPTAPTAAVGASTTQLATTAFVNPGSSIAGAGPWYSKAADGTIEQWGQVTYTTHSGNHTVSLPTSFNAIQGVWLETVAATIGWDTWVVAGTPGVSSFQFTDDAASGNTVTINWRARGR